MHDAVPAKYRIAVTLGSGLGLRQGEVFGLGFGEGEGEGAVAVQLPVAAVVEQDGVAGGGAAHQLLHRGGTVDDVLLIESSPGHGGNANQL